MLFSSVPVTKTPNGFIVTLEPGERSGGVATEPQTRSRFRRRRYRTPLLDSNKRPLKARDISFLDMLRLDWMSPGMPARLVNRVGLQVRVLHHMEQETRWLRRKHPDVEKYWMQMKNRVYGLTAKKIDDVLSELEKEHIVESQIVGPEKWWRLAKENWEWVARFRQDLET